MPLLILDLDETAIVVVHNKKYIHKDQTLSDKTCQVKIEYNNQLFYKDFQIINPNLLANLIESAYSKYDGILILTSGVWPESIRDVLADNLNLSEEVKKQLRNCYFHSPVTDSIIFGIQDEELKYMSKNDRLSKIVSYHPELTTKHFTLLDDSRKHIASFEKNPKVRAVLATTWGEDLEFYFDAQRNMYKCSQLEKPVCISNSSDVTFINQLIENGPSCKENDSVAKTSPAST